MNKKILITGASGYVGSYVYRSLCKSHDVVGTYNLTKLFDELQQVDITDSRQVRNIIDETNPDIIIHILLAADVHSKTCENDPLNAQALNVDATKYIADIAKEKGIRVIYLSTFACYSPSNVYGKTKFEAEKIIQTLDSYVILRASLIVGTSPNRKSHNFFNDILDSIKNKQDMEVDSSWQFEMTYLGHLSEVISGVIGNTEINKLIIPVVARGVTSRYKIANSILKDYNLKVQEIDQNRVIPQPDLDYSAYKKFSLPQYTVEECLRKMKEEVKRITKT